MRLVQFGKRWINPEHVVEVLPGRLNSRLGSCERELGTTCLRLSDGSRIELYLPINEVLKRLRGIYAKQ